MSNELLRIRSRLSKINSNNKMMESSSIRMLMMCLRMTRKMMMMKISMIAKMMKKSRKLISCRSIKRDVDLIKMDKIKTVMKTQTMMMSLQRKPNNRKNLMTQLATTKMITALRTMLKRWNSVDKIDYRPAQTMTWMMLMTLMKKRMLS